MVWILFIVLFCTVGAFFGVMFCNGIKNKVVRWISGILVSILVSWFVIGMNTLESKIDANTWNNCICPTCEIEWTFSNADHIKNGGTHYYWHCENCNKIIEVHQQF